MKLIMSHQPKWGNRSNFASFKRPKEEDPQHSNLKDSSADDPFDDCFTGDELRELELVATQAEGIRERKAEDTSTNFLQNNNFKSISTTTIKHEMISTGDAQRLSDANNEITRLQGVISEKSGEVLLLRDKVSNVERLLHSEKQVKLQEEKSRKIERSQKEIELEKRVDQLKDRLEFKEAELQEAHHLIKNLETKNKEKITDFETLRAKTFKPFCSDELSPKRLKTVKPENPQVLVKKKTSRMKHSQVFERNTSSQEESTDRRKEIDDTIVQSRRQCVVKPFWDKAYLIPPSHHWLFYKLSTFHSTCSRSFASDVYFATQRLLESNANDGSVVSESETIISFATCVLYKFLHKTKGGADTHLVSPPLRCFCGDLVNEYGLDDMVGLCFKVIVVLLENIDGFTRWILDEEVMNLLHRYFDQNSYRCGALRVLSLCLKRTAVYPTLNSILETIFDASRVSSCDNYYLELLQFLCDSMDQRDVVEKVISVLCKEDSPTLLMTVTEAVLNFDRASTSWFANVEKLIQYLTSVMMCDISSNHNKCFTKFFHMIIMILFELLNKPPKKAPLIDKSIYSLYACVSSLQPDVAIPRSHKIISVYWKVLDFLECKSKSLWREELRRMLLEAVEAFQ